MKTRKIISLLNFYFNKFKKQGFTLAEALIITVMTGACLLPILGTMQNAQIRTEAYDHQSKMQQYTRSRLTAEIANAAFDHKSINLADEYHYIAYYDKNGDEDNSKLIEFPKTYVTPEEIASLSNLSLNDEWSEASMAFLGITSSSQHYFRLVHAYKTTVEVNSSPRLDYSTNGTNADNTDTSFASPKALMGIVVKTCLLESNDQHYFEEDGCLKLDTPIADEDGTKTNKDKSTRVLPVTLFSFVNLPTISEEKIWLANAENWRLQCIDPIGKSAYAIDLPQKYNTFDKEKLRPIHISIHPSLRFLAYQTNELLFFINLDRKSIYYKNVVYIQPSKSSPEIGRGGIAFRPDGNYLFVVDKDSGLQVFPVNWSIDPSTNSLKWVTTAGDTGNEPSINTSACSPVRLDSDKVSALVPANDGYLYVAIHDKKKVIRVSIYFFG